MADYLGLRNSLLYGDKQRPFATEALTSSGPQQTSGLSSLMGIRQAVLQQQMARQGRTPAQQLTALSPAPSLPPKRPSLGDRISGMLPTAGTPEAAGLGAAGQRMLQLSGWSDRPVAMSQILGEAAKAYTTARKETAAEQAAAERQRVADARQAMLDKQATEMHRAKIAEMTGKKPPKLETLYDQESGLEYKAYYAPNDPNADEFGYVQVGGIKAGTKPKREIRSVDNVGLVDITDPDNPKVILPSEDGEKRDLRTVGGVGVVDFTDPDNPKVVYESVPSETRRYQNIGAYMLNGEYLGEGTFDTKTNKRFMIDPDGKEIPIPPEAIPITESLMGKGILGATAMQAVDAQLVDLSNGLTRYVGYLQNLKNTETGYRRLGDQLSTYIKNFISTNHKKFNLSESEFALAVATGQQQGLLGSARIETVGGGVMTEQDALRVIQNLGGNIDALQNPEVVADQIGRMFAQKYRVYEQQRENYNRQVNAFYKGMGYKPMPELDIDMSVIPAKYRKEMGFEVAEVPGDESQDVGISQPPKGVSPDVWAEMTAEEKALWNE